nr:MAG TPA: hypothetical protein [Caudoviricetes sp.]
MTLQHLELVHGNTLAHMQRCIQPKVILELL